MSDTQFETIAIRSQLKQTEQKEHAVPLFLTSSFTFDSAEHGAQIFGGHVEGNLYSRFTNPNTAEFIAKLCALEKCEAGVATASGMAAVYVSMAALLKQGDHIIASRAIFGNSHYVITELLSKMGVSHTLVDIDDNEGFAEAVQPHTRMLFVETPANPTLKCADLSYLGKLCKDAGIVFSVDNCFASPYLQNPIDFGADLVIHSATKYIDGQGRVLGGAILGSADLIKVCYDFVRRTGASLSPFNAWVLSKSLETLAVRMDRHCSNALAIANFLDGHESVEQIYYPHHQSNAQYDLAQNQMRQGGGLVGFKIEGGAERAMAFLNELKLFTLTANLGDTRSIATHPASTTHAKLSQEERATAGIAEAYLRLSVGLENVQDLIKDIDQAIVKSSEPKIKLRHENRAEIF